MTQQNKSQEKQVHAGTLIKRMFLGATIALVLIAIFLSGVDEPDPAWPELWFIRPLLVVPVAGAMGGALYYYIDLLRRKLGWNKIIAVLVSLFGYVVALWLGTVVGLDGTLWN